MTTSHCPGLKGLKTNRSATRPAPQLQQNAEDWSQRLSQLKATRVKDRSPTHPEGAVFHQHLHLSSQSTITGLNRVSSVITDPDQKSLLFLPLILTIIQPQTHGNTHSLLLTDKGCYALPLRPTKAQDGCLVLCHGQ